VNSLRIFWKENKPVLFYIAVLFIATRIVLFAIGTISQHYISATPSQSWKYQVIKTQPSLSMWAVWDSKWYMSIATRGYEPSLPFNPNVQQPIGFFPLYPMIVRVLSWLFGDPLVVGLILSNIALIAGSFLLYKLVVLDFGDETARRSLWYLYLFPTAYIFSAFYPEALLLLSSVGAILAARHERWWLAGTLGFFATLAKPVGVLVLIPLAMLYFKSRKIRMRTFFSLLLVPLGLVCFGLYSYFATGDFLAYSHIQEQSWGHYI
jgi:Gpi18-like mannosyltransferase